MLRASSLAFLLSTAFSAQALAQRVTTEAQLQQAVQSAQPGATIILADGTYTLSSRLAPSTGGSSSSPITVKAEHQYAAILDTNGNEEAFQMSVPYWTFDGLYVKVRGGSAHAFKLDTSGQHITVMNGKMELDTMAEAAIKGSGGPTAPQPDDALIQGNEIWFDGPTLAVNSEGIDAVAVADWIIRGNVIHDIQKDKVTQDGIAYGAFTKGNSQNTIIENNVFYNCFISISLGGGGTGPQYFRDGDTTYEERNGIIRNNMAFNSNDVAVYLNLANNARIYNNTLVQSFQSCGTSCSSIDVRYAGSTADVRNNILDKPINDRDGGTHMAGSNMMLPSPGDTSWFVDAANHNLRLLAGTPPIDQGETLSLVPTDIDGTTRPVGPAYDVGAFEWSSTPPPPHDGGVPPPMDASVNPADASASRDASASHPDAGSPSSDAGPITSGNDASTQMGGGDAGMNRSGAASGGCGCMATRQPPLGTAWAMMALVVLWAARRRVD
jgi:MYXO-CTERM domain-containing protein